MDNKNKLLAIQTELKAPKDLLNSFGGYHYRSCESILEALKPLLLKHGVTLFLDDEIVAIGNRVYVKTTATFIDGDLITKAHGWAREDESRKGMDASQLTGSTASYSAKRCLGNLFLIDDAKDSDFTNKHEKEEPKPAAAPAKKDPMEMGKMAPPTEGKRAIGKITNHKAGTIFHEFSIEGYEGNFSTKIQGIIDSMLGFKEEGQKVCVTYTETHNGRYVNRYISKVESVLGDVPF